MRNAEAVNDLEGDLRTIFAARLQSLVVYGAADTPDTPVSTLAIVDALTATDLQACAQRAHVWRQRGLATLLILEADEFGRSLDAFPFEFGAILAEHAIVAGVNPFDGLAVDPVALASAVKIARDIAAETGLAPARVDGLLALKGVIVADDVAALDPEVRGARDTAILESLGLAFDKLAKERLREGANLAQVLGAHNISIASVIQHDPGDDAPDDSPVPLVIMTHHAVEADLKAALSEIDRRTNVVSAPSICLGVEE